MIVQIHQMKTSHWQMKTWEKCYGFINSSVWPDTCYILMEMYEWLRFLFTSMWCTMINFFLLNILKKIVCFSPQLPCYQNYSTSLLGSQQNYHDIPKQPAPRKVRRKKAKEGELLCCVAVSGLIVLVAVSSPAYCELFRFSNFLPHHSCAMWRLDFL